MPSVPISQLPPVSDVSPSAYVPLDQDGVTSRATVAQIGAAAQSLDQSFVTVGSESATLPNSRGAGATNGITLTDSGPGGTLTFSLTGQALNFFLLSTTGLVSLTGGGSVVTRALVGPGKGFAITNADGVSGNPTFALTGGLLSLEDLTGPGVVCSTGVDTFTPRTLTGTTNQIDITNPQGAAGDPTFSIATDPRLPGTGGFLPPGGTTAERPLSPPQGFTRRNTSLNVLETWNGAQWVSQATAGVSSVAAIGANGISVTGSPITSAGTLTITLDPTGVTAGTYGSASTVPVPTFNAQGQATGVTTATITPASIGGVPSSRTLTAGTGLTGGGDLSADRTFALAVSGVSAGTYNNVTVDIYGRATSGTNQPYITGNQTITLSGDVSGSGTTAITATLATVNANVGTFGSTTAVPVITADAKGRITAISTAALGTMAVQNAASVAITGGSIDGTTIGGTTAAAGTFTTLAATSGTVGGANIVTVSASQTLTNKTLTAPVIATISNTGTLTLPISTDTLVGRATTDTLSNKTIDTASSNVLKVNGNTLSATAGTATVTIPNSTDTLVGRATTDTLTNKTLTAPKGSAPTSSYSSSITLDFSTGPFFSIGALTNNLTLANPSNVAVGMEGLIYTVQDGTGGRTISFGANWVKIGSVTATTTASKINAIAYSVPRSTSEILYSIIPQS